MSQECPFSCDENQKSTGSVINDSNEAFNDRKASYIKKLNDNSECNDRNGLYTLYTPFFIEAVK